MLINGEAYAFAQLDATIAGQRVWECLAISFSEKQEKKNNYGLGIFPTSRGRGIVEYDASITLTMVEVEKIKANAPNRRLLAVKPFNITLRWSEDGIKTVVMTLKGCEFLESKMDSKSGDVTTEIELPLIISQIEW